MLKGTNCTSHGHPVTDNKTSTRFLPLGKGCYSRSNHLTLVETGINNTVHRFVRPALCVHTIILGLYSSAGGT
jgi:hypothetical protein